MKVKVYDADTGELLQETHHEDTWLPPVGETWAFKNGAKKVVEAAHLGDPANSEVFIAVKVR